MSTSVTGADVARMSDALFIQRGPKASKFWTLLVLAAVIATAGVLSDSTATVIGAMIVAPLMTPILGTSLALVLVDRHNLARSIGLVAAGALSVIAIAYVLGWAGHPMDAYATNSQVSGRISPTLIDLMAALATGTVGAFALVRRDISDALPGVAIAISLVPPLAVVGLLLQVGRYSDAAGAGLLFLTNLAAIVATGTFMMLGYRVRQAAPEAGIVPGKLAGITLVVVVATVIAVAVPLTAGSLQVAHDAQLLAKATPLARQWAVTANWQVSTVTVGKGTVVVTAIGSPPDATPEQLRVAMNDNGMSGAGLQVRQVLGGAADCPAGGTTCRTSAN
jgi:uncharacterized hydrophobic protein (TIGR00271 family)